MAKKTGHMVPCEQCGTLVYKTQYLLSHRDHQFCSQECAIQWRHLNAYEQRLCEVCGAEFECAKKSTQRFCSTVCQKKWQTTRVGESNPRYCRLSVQCDWCGEELVVKRYKALGSQKNFCNASCRRLWYSNVWSQQDLWKEASRKRAVDILSNGICTHTDTAPQRVVNEILKELDITYINEAPLGAYSMDNKLCDVDLYIQVTGDYWHALPTKYLHWDTLTKQQKKRIRSDANKSAYATGFSGVRILYLWESDCMENRDLCKALIKTYYTDRGILPDYHSFNWRLSDGVLCLNDKIIESPWIHFDNEIAS